MKKWSYIFFDKVDTRPYVTFRSQLDIQSVEVVFESKSRVKIIIGNFGWVFFGNLVLKFYGGSPFILVEAEMQPQKSGTAYIFDGLLGGKIPKIAFKDNQTDRIIVENPTDSLVAKKVRNRTIMALFPKGTIAIFPTPHAYIYPTENGFNLGFVQAGTEDGITFFGTKLHPKDDKVWRP